MSASLLLLVLSCATNTDRAGDILVDGEAFELTITPVYFSTQEEMIDEITSMELIVQDADGKEESFVMMDKGERRYENTGIDRLQDATLFLVGRDENGVVFHGRSAPVTVSAGTATVQILVARDGAPVPLPEQDTAQAMGATLSLGDGRFLTMGGSAEGTRVQEPGKDITIFNMRGLAQDAATTKLSSPIHAENASGWVGHTATLLPNGQVLVVGGAQSLVDEFGDVSGQASATSLVTLLDTEADKAVAASPLNHGRFAHSATLGPDGTVVVMGGFAARDGGSSVAAFVETYDPASDTWTVSTDSLYTGGLFHAAARRGSDCVIACGGMNTSFAPSSECQLIEPDGSISSMPDLAQPLLHAQLTPLDDERILLTGGLVTDETGTELPLDASLSATSAAWILEDGDWRAVGSMSIARAMHSTAITPSGRVVIAGGVSQINPTSARGGQAYAGLLFDAADALPCVEVFDPETESFTALSACGPGSTTGTLAEPVAYPGIAYDSVFGTLISGGLRQDPSSSSTQRTLIYTRFADRNEVE